MKLGDLTTTELADRMRIGLPVRIGPFLISLKSNVRQIVQSVRLLYADFPSPQDTEFIDFHVRVSTVPRIDYRLRRQTIFLFDGTSPFRRFPAATAAACLEWGLNRGIAARVNHQLVIHSAVLERHGRGAVLLGESGSGKSTLCAAMALRGWRLLSDELAIISPADGTIAALARPVILKNDSIGIIRNFSPGVCIGPEMPGTSKGTIAHMRPPAESVARAHESARPRIFVFVRFQPAAAARLEPVSKAQAHLQIAKNAFNYGILGRVGFETLANAVDSSPAFTLTYGKLADAIALLGRAVEAR